MHHAVVVGDPRFIPSLGLRCTMFYFTYLATRNVSRLPDEVMINLVSLTCPWMEMDCLLNVTVNLVDSSTHCCG